MVIEHVISVYETLSLETIQRTEMFDVYIWKIIELYFIAHEHSSFW